MGGDGSDPLTGIVAAGAEGGSHLYGGSGDDTLIGGTVTQLAGTSTSLLGQLESILGLLGLGSPVAGEVG